MAALGSDLTSVACPRCRAVLSPVALESGLFAQHCDSCGGILVDPWAWTEILTRAHALDLARLDPGGAPPSLSPARLAETVVCPHCHMQMDRARFSVQSGVLVDVCIRHGIWFDAGELIRAADYVSMRESSGVSSVSAPEPAEDLLDLRRALAREVELEPELLNGNGNMVYERLLRMGKLLGLVRR